MQRPRTHRVPLHAAGWLVVALTLAGLATGAGWLEWSLPGFDLPLGTLATAASFVILPALAFDVLAPGGLRVVAGLLVLVNLCWLPVSALLAGNLRLNFSDAPEAWWPVTLSLPLLSVMLWLAVALRAVLRRSGSSRGRDPGDG
ncbi:hypothetical protein [Halomonas denitrificans]|nr:hypothetical protein [Halomonas denitrificans]